MSSWSRLAVAWLARAFLGLFLVVAWATPAAGSAVAYDYDGGVSAYDTEATIAVIQLATVQASRGGSRPDSFSQVADAPWVGDSRSIRSFVAQHQ